MTGRYRGDIDNLRSHILTLRVILGLLVIFIMGLWYANEELKKVQRVHLPADISIGSTIQLNEVTKPTVYGFAYNTFQYLNTWLKNGSNDYPERVNQLTAYLTPTYKEWLINDIDTRLRKGELQGRTRKITLINGEVFDNDRIEKISAGRFVVWLDFKIDEYQSGIAVKSTMIRYPIKVVSANISIEDNSWGLQLDGYEGNPSTITKESEK